jgi:hypothetical protein
MYCRITASSRPTVETKISASPKALADKISLPFSVHTRDVDGTLSLDKADHLRHRVFRRDQDQHMHVIRLHMALLDPTLLLRSQLAEYFPKMLSYLPKQRLPPALGNEHDAVFALPFGVT